jgi:adenine-specific DNA-methyltransferase
MTNLDKLKDLLAELFMLDQADLDFGIYRVMNAKRAEVTRFLDHDLLPQVRTELEKISTGDRAGLETELAKAIAAARAAGFSAEQAEQSPKVKELRAQLAATVDVSALENEVLSDLANFFRRYYSGGDFLALRRYKAGVYAIPYEGEEVKLHWANADQYYIKTSEFLRDYTFKLADGKRVHFKLVEADTEADNKKSAAGQERRFILCAADPLLETDGELVIRFEYRPDADKRKQAELNTLAAQQIFNCAGENTTALTPALSPGERENPTPTSASPGASSSPSAASVSPSPPSEGGEGRGEVGRSLIHWLSALAAKAPTEKNPNRTLLEKHLGDYTARNSFDYFIHKDIGGFLRRELDFYIKNEIMHLDDIEAEDAPRVGQYLAKIKAIRAIARKIIDFLEQLENFQKKLWLKKKFVVETNYCVTLDRVAKTLYPEIAANDAQWQEWEKLFAISEIAPDLFNQKKQNRDAKFLKANPFLVLDTKFFPAEFREKLLADNKILGGATTLDAATDGLLIQSECFQGLSLLQRRYSQSVDCGFIDPPYNTGSDGFPYKDTYQHSSWYSMLSDRLGLVQKLLRQDALFSCNIDDHELYNLGVMLNSHLGENNRAACAPWKSEASGGKEKTGLRTGHEYLLIYHNGDPRNISQAERSTGALDREDKFGRYRKGRELRKWGGTSLREDRLGQWYALKTPKGEEVWPFRNDGKEGHWRWGTKNPGIIAALKDPDFFHWELAAYDPGVVVEGKTERFVPYEKIRNEKKTVGWTTWLDNFGTNADATRTLKDLFGFKPFETPKPVSLYLWLLGLHANENALAIDFFAGSGTVGQAVIESNREDGEDGKRKYILIEMGDYFDTVLKPRIQKVIYSKDWKDGKPVSREGSSHLFKYLRLESYEDALNNLELKRTEAQDDLLRQHAPLREDYLLRYQLDVESAGSASLLAVAQFAHPFAYQLKIATGSVGESRAVNVDLVETFNYLLGLCVSHTDTIRGFKVVTGLNPAGEKTLVIWRNIAEKSNADLDAFFQKQRYNTKDMEFAVIYVNGDNNLENLKRADETWKVRRTEDEFKRLMFDMQDV